MRESKNSAAFQDLLAIAGRLKFHPHRITHQLDAKGRHELELPEGFPFVVSLFYFCAGAVTQRLTGHQRLELLVPLDGPLSERMGDLVVALQPGDVLVVDHLKPHQISIAGFGGPLDALREIIGPPCKRETEKSCPILQLCVVHISCAKIPGLLLFSAVSVGEHRGQTVSQWFWTE